MYGSDVNLVNVGNSRCDLGFGVTVLTGITICSEGLAYFRSSYPTLRTVCDVGGYPVVQEMGYSQLLVFWVEILLSDRETTTSRRGREDLHSSSFVNWMCLQTEFKC